ncbi:hypothetical protein PVAP13_9KG414198, partial [Panicum virgatum]
AARRRGVPENGGHAADGHAACLLRPPRAARRRRCSPLPRRLGVEPQRSRPHQRPPRLAPPQHRLPAPRQGRRAHHRALPSLEPRLALVPLVLVDAHLLPCGDLTVPVSRALAAHPGPFRGIYLTGTPLDAHRAEVSRWLRLFAAKGVEELTLFNRAQTMAANPPLPDTLFNCSSLTRLYLGFWRFPDTAALPDTHTACFPYLLELGLCALLMEQRDIAFLIEKCPVLEKLVIVGSRHPVYLRIESRSLICVQVCSAVVPEIVISDAVSLKRLLLWEAWGPGCLANMRCRIKIGHSPNLQSLGFLVPGMHELQIGDTLIEVGGEATVPSLQILAVQVRLGASREAKKLPVLLRCFPNIDTLIVQCEKNVKDHFRGASPKLHQQFWRTTNAMKCVKVSLKELVLHGFQGTVMEMEFLKFIARHGNVLNSIVVFTSHPFKPAMIKQLESIPFASDSCSGVLLVAQFEEGTPWCYKRGFALSIRNPFDVTYCLSGPCGT